ncbi:MAG: sensor domain-containing diguanylate cyclase [Desulfarculaceae bacterium]|nr:sensor domain-containing diguanylate cyclase [Desulfarculaceae bacterium]MCF8073327.1 sensor domain-containing diguanylate cyclase [Desulfarculaceae bacterium]MCF8103237.1 sensor domain-containing diguanylate cyclase [Desulfarculaceae bacterium]MCF8116621.1 sensor domain-containing diguanylate cyclase [Desulfarculaceae bacterium]
MTLKPKYIGLIFWLMLACWLGSPEAASQAGSPLVVHPEQDRYLLAPYMEILEDPSRQLTLDQVSRPPWSTRFHPANDAPTLRLGLTNAAVWLRFRISGLEPRRSYYLEMDSAQIEELDAYLPQTGAGGALEYQTVVAGSSHPFKGRPLPHRTFLIPIRSGAPPGDDFYLRLDNAGSLIVRPYLWSEQGLAGHLNRDNLFFGVIYGVLVAMLLTNLFFFVALRDPVYILYVIYVVSMLVFEACLYGHWDLWLPGAVAQGQTALWMASGLLTIFAAQFTRSFLRTRQFSPRLDKVFLAIMAGGLLVIILTLAGAVLWSTIATHALGLAGPVFALWAAVQAWRRGYWPARFFLLAWSVLMVATFQLAVKGLGYLPQALSSTYTMPLATAIEAVLLSLALAERVRNLRHRGEEAARREQRFQHMSMTDELTGLYNKRFFDSRLRGEMDHSQRTGQSLSLLMVDVDNFKGYNDAHGHTEGDKVLRILARIMLERIRAGDYPCRYGGDEFVVIMPGTETAQAVMAAERVRTGFHDHPFQPGDGATVWTSLSAGIAQWQPGDSPEQFTNRADAAMYRAKRDGGNRCAKS